MGFTSQIRGIQAAEESEKGAGRRTQFIHGTGLQQIDRLLEIVLVSCKEGTQFRKVGESYRRVFREARLLWGREADLLRVERVMEGLAD